MAGAYFALGDWAARARDSAAGRWQSSRNCIALQPENEAFLYGLANVLSPHGEPAGADQAVPAQPTRPCGGGPPVQPDFGSAIPRTFSKRLDWTFAQQRLGSILISLGDLKGALEAFEQVLPIREQLRALDPNDARAQMNLANSHASIGYVLLEMGNARDRADRTSSSSASSTKS